MKSTCREKVVRSTNLLLCAADVLHLCDQGRLALVQRLLQLLERSRDFSHGPHLPVVELPGDLRHQLDGRCQLREPAGPRFTLTSTSQKNHTNELTPITSRSFYRSSTHLAVGSMIYGFMYRILCTCIYPCIKCSGNGIAIIVN